MPATNKFLPTFCEALTPSVMKSDFGGPMEDVIEEGVLGVGVSDPEFTFHRNKSLPYLNTVEANTREVLVDEEINSLQSFTHLLPRKSDTFPVGHKMVTTPTLVLSTSLEQPCPVLKSTKSIKSRLLLELETALEVLSALLYGLWGILAAVVMTFIPRRFRYKDVSGQVILITGAGSGIGKLMAKKFALVHGAIVVAWDINPQGNEDTVKAIQAAGGKCHGYIVDVSSRDTIYKTAEKVKKDVGKVDILINNAGIVFGKRLLDTPDESIIKTFEVNALSNFWMMKAFLPAMLESGKGHIVTISSLGGLFGSNRLVDYCASKFAAVGFDEALKHEIKAELGHSEIHATLVCPYYINTGMFDGVRSKIIPLLSPEPTVNDIVAGILTNQEQIVIPRYVYILVVLRLLVPGEVGRRIASAVGITGAMLTFKGSSTKKSNTCTMSSTTNGKSS